MFTAKRSLTVKIVAFLLIAVMLCPVQSLAVENRASYYLSSYTAYIYQAAFGKIQIWFDVDGTRYMDEIGALEIQLYESKDNSTWTWLKTYEHQNDAGMLEYNDHTYMGHVDYNGTVGRYYKAYVCVWAGKDGDGDARYFWTTPKKATLFAQ